MSFLNYIEKSFPRVLAVDTEFRFKDQSKTIIDEVVCVVFQDIFNPKDVFKVWTAGRKHVKCPFEFRDCLLIPFVATAEAQSFLTLFWGTANNIWDVFVENSRLYKTFRSGKGALNLLTTANHYGIPEVMTKEQKDYERSLIVNNKTYDNKLKEQILTYCEKDVDLTRRVFLKQVEDIEAKNYLKTDEDYYTEITQILFRGMAQSSVSKMERAGIPIDYPKVKLFKDNWDYVEKELIKRYNKQIDCFDEFGTLKYDKFVELVKRNNVFDTWERTFKSGKLRTDKKYIERFLHLEDFKTYKVIKDLMNITRLAIFNPGYDGRLRCSWNMFGTETGRCSSSSSGNIFGGSKWQRAFIKPSWGSCLVYLDYEQQELAIAGYLAGDKKLIEAYNSGCGYMQTAKWLDMCPQFATKETHPEIRENVKTLFFALNYGAGPGYVASNLGITLLKANHTLIRFKQLYKVYVSWIGSVLKSVAMTQRITTRLGWQRHSNGTFKINKDGKMKSIRNTLLNFPMQGNGSDILRQAIIKLQEANFEVVAPVHDAVLVQIPLGDHEARIKEAQNIMVEASEFVVGGPIRVGKEVIYSNWQQKEKDQKFFNDIFNEIRTYCKSEIEPTADRS